MAITTETEPANGRKALREPLQFLFNRTPTGGAITNLYSTQPHRAYTIDLADLAAGKLLDATVAGVFRYLIIDPGSAASAAPRPVAEAFIKDAGGQPSFAGMRVGPATTATMEALVELEAMPAVQAEDFELRYLEIPALRFHAIWLAGTSTDIVRPLAPTPTALAPHAVVPLATLQASLQTAARDVLAAQARAAGASAG